MAINPYVLGGALGGQVLLGEIERRGRPKAPDISGFEAANDEIMKKLEAGIPLSFEEEVWLEDYAPVLLSQSEGLGPSKASQVTTDPRYLESQLAALAALEEEANTGFSQADKARMMREDKNLRRNTAGQLGAIRQGMQRRGITGSGLDLMAQLQASEAADEQASMLALEREARGEGNRRSARLSAAELAGGLDSREYQRKMDAARAQDEIEAFNLQNRMRRQEMNANLQNEARARNLEGRQRVASSNVQGRNNFAQQTFNNRRGIAELQYNANTAKANRALDQYGNKLQSRQNQFGQFQQGLGTLATAAILSDKKAKNNVSDLSDDVLDEFLDSLSPKAFNYKGDPSPRVGVIAQDVEQSPMGKTMVVEMDGGLKGLDRDDVIGALLGAVSLLHRRQKGV
jgi:hypothetical protein